MAGGQEDIRPATAEDISQAIRRAHAVIWAGGKRDPLSAFDEWSKLMFAKVRDERHTPNGSPRGFQVGAGESAASVSNRVHRLFDEAKEQDLSIFPRDERLDLPDSKVCAVVRAVQDISFVDTDSDVIGTAFEGFFGSVFRGGLGQYFTMRPIARFVVGALRPTSNDYVLDPTCGSGGFLLESLLQVWDRTDRDFAGQSNLERVKTDFALQNVYGVEIHPTLARICKISLLLHHDGHTNIEADRSCLSPNLSRPRLRKPEAFDVVIGNPPFGTQIREGDEDQLDGTPLGSFELAQGASRAQSEHIIVERSVEWLKPGGRLGLVLPDGVFNNSGDRSNCPAVREWLFRKGRVRGVISLPDFAFRRSGATNKTSVLIFEKFSHAEESRLSGALAISGDVGQALLASGLDYEVFFAEADHIGYTPSGRHDARNDLYHADEGGRLADEQDGSILGEWRRFTGGGTVGDRRCVTSLASDVWACHASHRIDPKYHVYKAHERELVPDGWSARALGEVVERRAEPEEFEEDSTREYRVLTISQSGRARLRPAGVGNNPPEWLGMYFADSSSRWYKAHAGDIVYSGIDLWKGSVCLVPPELDGALVTQEYPILHVKDEGVNPEFLAMLLRSNRMRRAFRAINTGHSNRRRTQASDFYEVLVCIPPQDVQRSFVEAYRRARGLLLEAEDSIKAAESSLDAALNETERYDYEDPDLEA